MKQSFKFGIALAGLSIFQTAWNWANPAVPSFHATSFLTEQKVKEDIAAQEAQKILRLQNCPTGVPMLAAKASLENGIPVRVIAADIVVESSCNPHAISKAGAVGLMQINRHIWKTNKNLFNPEENVNLGTKILSHNMRKYGLRNGLRHYFGCTPYSNASDLYAAKVLSIAKRGA